MVEIEVAYPEPSFLGAQNIGAGDVQKYRVNFLLLDPGVHISAATATVTSVASSVSTPTLSPEKTAASFLVTAATNLEVFTLGLQINTTDGQTLNFQIVFYVESAIVRSSIPNPIPLLIGPTGPTGPANSVFPDVDPHVAGAGYWVAGVLTKSAG